MTIEDPDLEAGKNIDVDELLASFSIDLPDEHTDPEKSLRKELSSLKQMRRTLTDIDHEVKKCEREEEKSKAMKPREKAKEEAMKLLKSGAISIENKNERHTFKRKLKESEEEETLGPNVNSKMKQSLYHNFLPGPTLNPLRSDEKKLDDLSHTKAYTLETNCTGAPETVQTKRKQQFNVLLDNKNIDTDQIPDVVDSHNAVHLNSPNRPMHSTLYVGYHNITEPFIYDVFKQHGTVVKIKIGDPSNHAYVTMATSQMAQSALKLDHQMVSNRLLRVSYARKPSHMKPFSSTKSNPDRLFRKIASSDPFPSNEEPSNRTSSEPNRDLGMYGCSEEFFKEYKRVCIYQAANQLKQFRYFGAFCAFHTIIWGYMSCNPKSIQKVETDWKLFRKSIIESHSWLKSYLQSPSSESVEQIKPWITSILAFRG
ncbi:negative elongation factor e isoform 2 [Schistosoma japonicum]|uniref:Negative elongation factor e isoform 2 n=1 Tax=Schistosoma japonicum TaxID=6182 RepID=A0A4Z2DEM4_SCHJA|nr:negative elongation factor e isoform 2 [Schistosoma japonicum]